MATTSEEEDDIAALIWQESQRRKREAAAAATEPIKIKKPKKSSPATAILNVTSKNEVRRVINTSKWTRQPDSGEEGNKASMKRSTRSAERCTNNEQGR